MDPASSEPPFKSRVFLCGADMHPTAIRRRWPEARFLAIGWVDGINATVMVTYATGVTRFVGQVLVNGKGTFSRAGDSGSLIVTTAGRQPVALLFAGASNGYTFANPIGAVLKAFNVTIDGT